MRALVSLGLIVLVGIVVTGTGRAELEKKEAPSFTKEVRPFLAKYCYECHGDRETKAGIDVTSYRKLTQASGKKKKIAVVPGNPDRSRLLMTMEGKAKAMPPKKYDPKPTADEIKKIREWIAAGAPDDSAKKASE